MAATESFSAISISEYSEAPSETDVTMANRSLSQILSDLDAQLKTAVTLNDSNYSTNTAVGINPSDYSLHTAVESSESGSSTESVSQESTNTAETETLKVEQNGTPVSIKVENQESVSLERGPQKSLSNMSVETGVSNLVASDSDYSIISAPEMGQHQNLDAGSLAARGSTSGDDLVTCISGSDDETQVVGHPVDIKINETRVQFDNQNQFIEINGMLNQTEPFKLGIELEPVDYYDPSNFSSSVTFSMSEIDYTTTAISSDTDEDYVPSASETTSDRTIFDDMTDIPELTPRATHACIFIKSVHEVIDEANMINNLTQESVANNDPEPERNDFWAVTTRFIQIPINFGYNIASSVIRLNLFFFKLPLIPLKLIYGSMIYLYENLAAHRSITGPSEPEDESERLISQTEEEDQRLRELEQEYLRTRQATFSFSDYSTPTNEATATDPEGTMQLQASTSVDGFRIVTAADEVDNSRD